MESGKKEGGRSEVAAASEMSAGLGAICEHSSLKRKCLICELTEERENYRTTIKEFLSTVLTIKRENQDEWMEYLAERINDVCEAIGEGDRFVYNQRREAILPVRK